MKKRVFLLPILFFILFTGLILSCSRDNDILATSNITNITKNDFSDWLEAKKIKKEAVQDSKESRKKLLESMAMEIFIMDKAKAEDFDKSKRIMALKERRRESILNKYFTKMISDIAAYNEPVIRVSYILLPVNRYKQDPENRDKKIRLDDQEHEKNFEELMTKAKGLIKRLDEGDSFEDLAAEFSGDSNRKSCGDLGYIIKDMMPVYFSEPAFVLKKGEYTKTPVTAPNGVYIIKVTDTAYVTEKNIDEAIEDENQRERIRFVLIEKFKETYLTRLENADDIKFMYEKDKTYNIVQTLFSIGTKDFTIGDIESIYESRATQEELEKAYEKGVLPDEIKFAFAEKYFKYLVWSREAERLGVDKDPEYLKELKEKEINLIMTEYLDARISKEKYIPYQEIMEEYEKNKETKYSDKVLEEGVIVDKPMPLDVVKEEIIAELKKKVDLRSALDLKKKMFDLYNFEINEAALQVN